MQADGTLQKAVSALIRFGEHSRETARRFLGRCTLDETRRIAECDDSAEFTVVIERILDRQEIDASR